MDAEKVNRESGMPPYRQCAAILRRRIRDRVYTGRLPSETALAAELGVATNTLRKALAILREEEHLIGTAQGWGSWVLGPDG